MLSNHIRFRCTTDLLLVHASEAEHADLVGDVAPVLGRALLLQALLQLRPHRDDPAKSEQYVENWKAPSNTNLTSFDVADNFVLQGFPGGPTVRLG